MSWLARRRRRRLLQTPFPPEWLVVVDRNVPIVRRLSEADKAELLGLVQLFLAEKSFEGAGGLEMTDEIRVTIAAQACMLLLGRETEVYPALRSVIVYPTGYFAGAEDVMADGTICDEPEERFGESWGHGAVVLSWEDVLFGASNPDDGENIVFHEFAHQLDEETGDSNGVPLLDSPELYAEWARVMSREYDDFVEKVSRRRRVLMDEYAAENPAEFFAVATEFYLERPAQLKARRPELFSLLNRFYRRERAEDGRGI